MMPNTPKLLIVDDDPGIRSQLKWGFDQFDVVTAEDREDALAQFGKYHPAVVTLDLGLPPDAEGSREGFATLQQILEQEPDTKVIIVSGSEEKGSAKKAVDFGAFDYFSKPVDLDRLGKIVERAYKAYKNQLDK